MALTKQQHKDREGKIGASDATIIMSGDPDKLTRLCLEKRGMIEPEDLSDNVFVRIGEATEHLHAEFARRREGLAFVHKGEWAQDPFFDWRGATLDFTCDKRPVEAKFHGGMSSFEDLAERYHWQLTHQAVVCASPIVGLSVLFGLRGLYMFAWLEIRDEDVAILTNYESRFMAIVRSKKPITPETWLGFPNIDSGANRPQAERHKVYDMRASNEFAVHAVNLIETADAYAAYQEAEAGIKALIPDDAKAAFYAEPGKPGSAVVCTIKSNGAKTVKVQAIPPKLVKEAVNWQTEPTL